MFPCKNWVYFILVQYRGMSVIAGYIINIIHDVQVKLIIQINIHTVHIYIYPGYPYVYIYIISS